MCCYTLLILEQDQKGQRTNWWAPTWWETLSKKGWMAFLKTTVLSSDLYMHAYMHSSPPTYKVNNALKNTYEIHRKEGNTPNVQKFSSDYYLKVPTRLPTYPFWESVLLTFVEQVGGHVSYHMVLLPYSQPRNVTPRVVSSSSTTFSDLLEATQR